MPQTKPDVTLSDGRTVVFDFNAVTIREWRSLFDTKQPDDEEYRIVGKMIGLRNGRNRSLWFSGLDESHQDNENQS